jgi:hypothetical protein
VTNEDIAKGIHHLKNTLTIWCEFTRTIKASFYSGDWGELILISVLLALSNIKIIYRTLTKSFGLDRLL